MGKHAFLIMAHRDDLSFRSLIQQLDDDNSDIFIHMDEKNTEYNSSDINKLIEKSNIYHVKRTNVTWGGFSQIACELILLAEATKTGQYDYYHLLSGQDLLIANMEDLYDFFSENQGKEFIRFQSETFTYEGRVQYYSMQDMIGKNKNGLYYFDRILRELQNLLNIKRNRNVDFQKGTNWFSITDDLARFVVSKSEWVYKIFKYTICADEIFLQTIVHNSEFRNRLYMNEYNNQPNAIMRLIDWDRGTPYTFRQEDFNQLIDSDMFFARKFDENIDKTIIVNIVNFYK